VCISGGNFGLVIGDRSLHYLFPNLKRKHCSERTLPNGNIGAIAISVAHQRQYAGNTNRIYADKIPQPA
jgi:hypothetical protein